jgi:hypothetical protein
LKKNVNNSPKTTEIVGKQPAADSFTVAMQLINLQSCGTIRAHAIGSLRPLRSLRPPLPSVNIFSSSPIGSEQAKGRAHLITFGHPKSALPSANYSAEKFIHLIPKVATWAAFQFSKWRHWLGQVT